VRNPFHLQQSTFNRLFTTAYSLFFMGYTIWVTAYRIPFQWEVLTGFIIPTVNHIIHQVNLTRLESQNITSDLTKTLARNGKLDE
jgi:hypothetical protein